jgi:hypothetical protein
LTEREHDVDVLTERKRDVDGLTEHERDVDAFLLAPLAPRFNNA